MSSTSIIPQLGLVCITVSKEVRYSTVTRKRLLQLSETEQAEILRNLYAKNLQLEPSHRFLPQS
jgi:UV DNA damage endonuclease